MDRMINERKTRLVGSGGGALLEQEGTETHCCESYLGTSKRKQNDFYTATVIVSEHRYCEELIMEKSYV